MLSKMHDDSVSADRFKIKKLGNMKSRFVGYNGDIAAIYAIICIR
jgi:hypothetical protein